MIAVESNKPKKSMTRLKRAAFGVPQSTTSIVGERKLDEEVFNLKRKLIPTANTNYYDNECW